MGFFELIVIAIVGLLVVGPEKLPTTIRTGVVWFSKIKKTITDTRSEIEQQIGVDEIKRELRNEQIMRSLDEMKVNNGAEATYHARSAEEIVSDVESRVSTEVEAKQAFFEQTKADLEARLASYQTPAKPHVTDSSDEDHAYSSHSHNHDKKVD